MKMRLLFSYIFAFLASIIMYAIIIIGNISTYLTNSSPVLEEMQKQNYFERLSLDIEKEMKLDIISSGLPESILDNIYTTEMIKQEIESSLEATYRGETYEIQTEKVEENLKRNIEEYLEKNNIVGSDEESLNTFVKDTTNIYKSGINLYGYSKYIKEFIIKIKKPISWIMFLLIIIEVLLMIGIGKIHQDKHLGASFLTTTLLLLFTSYYIKEHIDINHLFIFNEFFSDTLKAITNNILNRISISEIILVILSLGCMVLNKNHSNRIE